MFLLVWNLFFTTSLTMCSTDMLIDNFVKAEFLSLTVICLIIGLLSDCWIGRFKVLKAAMYFLLVTIILKGVTIITPSSMVLYLAVTAWTFSFACYFTCIIQFATDQLIGASGEELSFIIYWLLWGLTTRDVIHKIAGCLPRLTGWKYLIMTFAASMVTFVITFLMIENCSNALMTKHLLGGRLPFTYWSWKKQVWWWSLYIQRSGECQNISQTFTRDCVHRNVWHRVLA